MYWNKDPRLKAGGLWKCAVKHRAKRLAYYNSLTGLSYLHERLVNRHNTAMYRRRQRKEGGLDGQVP